MKKQPKKLNNPSPEIPEVVRYKTHTFGIRANYLGVGAELDALMQKLDDSELIDLIWLYRLPEYQSYLQIRNDIRSISIDVNTHKAELAKCKDSKRKKDLEHIISSGTKALDTEMQKMYDPVISGIMLREQRLTGSINFRFMNDIDNLKAAASALLIGDLAVIDYDSPDKDLDKFRSDVFEVFFYTRGRIHAAQMRS